MKRFKIGKLIRDNMPEIMRQKEVFVHHRYMEHEEFIARLKDKLQEESAEVKQAGNDDELLEELADVLEVIHSLAKASDITMEQIEKARLEKHAAKGGFDKKIYSSFVDLDESNSGIDYFSKRGELPLEISPADS